jgi:hypothetical protein
MEGKRKRQVFKLLKLFLFVSVLISIVSIGELTFDLEKREKRI